MSKLLDLAPMTLEEILHHAEVFYDGGPQSLWDASSLSIASAVKKALASQKATGVVMELKFVPTRQGGLSIVAKLTGKEPAHIPPLPLAVFPDSRGQIFSEDPCQLKFQSLANMVRMPTGEHNKG